MFAKSNKSKNHRFFFNKSFLFVEKCIQLKELGLVSILINADMLAGRKKERKFVLPNFRNNKFHPAKFNLFAHYLMLN